MKSAVVFVLASMAVLSVNANGGGHGGGPGEGYGGGSGEDSGEDFGGLSCGGFDRDADDFYPRGCTCGTSRRGPCWGQIATSALQVGCAGTNSYLQCTGTVCAVATCPSGQVWNKTSNKCDVCRSDMQLSTDSQRCVCKAGTTFNRMSNACVACPTGFVQNADNCTCPATMALDCMNKACKACPANSNLTRGRCVCSATQFWDAIDWVCKDCPGSWVNVSASRRRVVQVCRCTGANQIFDRQNVKCFDCPTANPSTTADDDNDECKCNTGIRGQEFNMTTKACACERGQQPDATNTRCVRIPFSTTTKLP